MPNRCRVDQSRLGPMAPVTIEEEPNILRLTWSCGSGETMTLALSLLDDRPLIDELVVRTSLGSDPTVLARNLRPFFAMTVGSRDLSTEAGWTIFFDSPNHRPHTRHEATFSPSVGTVESFGSRARVTFDGLVIGRLPENWSLPSLPTRPLSRLRPSSPPNATRRHTSMTPGSLPTPWTSRPIHMSIRRRTPRWWFVRRTCSPSRWRPDSAQL